MGLNLEPIDLQFSYGGFHAFRGHIAKAANLPWPTSVWPEDALLSRKAIEKSKDPIRFFLLHSDCSGHIKPKKLKLILPRLMSLHKDLPVEAVDTNLALIKGIKKCIATNMNLRFL